MARPDRPPGLHTREGPAVALTPDPPHHARSPLSQQGSGVSVSTGAVTELLLNLHVVMLLDLSDERDQWMRRVLAAWREGYATGRRSMDDAVTTAYIDGLLRRKGIEHEHIRALTGGTDRVDLWQDQQKRTWGPGGREHFADPKPGDYMGGPVAWDGGQRR